MWSNDSERGREKSSEGEDSLNDLVRLTYSELKRLAARLLQTEYQGHTWQPTALVHEAFLNLRNQEKTWKDESHFRAIAAQSMRRVLLDHARGKNAKKRWGTERRISLEDASIFSAERSLDLISLNESLERLATIDHRQAKVVELRFFGGLTVEETAEVLAVSPKTVKRDWDFAKAWLYGDLKGQHGIHSATVASGQEPL